MAACTVLLLLLALLWPQPVKAGPGQPAPAGQIRLWFGGDVHFGSASANPLIPLRAIIGDAIGIVNLEGPVREPADTIIRNKVLKLFNAPRTLGYLATLNVKVATIANNHANDAGAPGKAVTERTLQERGIVPVGGSSADVLYGAEGTRLAIASYALSGEVPSGLGDALVGLRSTVDVLIVIFHVGGVPAYLPDRKLRQAVDIAVASGASIVVSHGRHAVGPVERRGDAVIAWGLGNLAFNCRCTDEREAVILMVTIDPVAKDRSLTSSCVIPIDAGMLGRTSAPAQDAAATFDLLEALGSPRLERRRDRACF